MDYQLRRRLFELESDLAAAEIAGRVADETARHVGVCITG